MLDRLTKKLDSLIEIGVPFYDCIVMKNGSCVYRHSAGFTDAREKAVTGREKYNIYSCSKLITCALALMLWERGLFSLEDRLSDYMPEFSDMKIKRGGEITTAKNPILIRHLFTMTAGFSYNISSPELKRFREETGGECKTRDFCRYLAKEPLYFEPGELWEYSLCHDVLAALVEVISGERFGIFAKKNIFDPLGMKDSTFLLDDDRLDEVINQYAYSPKLGVYERDKRNNFKLGRCYESGGAGCISTVDDYIKLLEALRIGDIILKKETVKMMNTNRIPDEKRGAYWMPNHGYGLGQRCPREGGATDFGWGGAAGAYYAIDFENEITIYFATHVVDYPKLQDQTPTIVPLIQDILK